MNPLTLESFFETSKLKLEKEGFIVNPYRNIQYGIQFAVFLLKESGLVRAYLGKKGLKLDLSQFENKDLADQVEHLLLEKPSTAQLIPFKNGDTPESNPDNIDTLIGVDESGKGDYFGPLVVAGVLVDPNTKKQLSRLGVTDSKKLGHAAIKKLAKEIEVICPHSLVVIGNASYNDLYEKIKNLNVLLAWGHARVIENVLDQKECRFALCDQFGPSQLIQNALMTKGKTITLFQKPKAESNIAVAAASILARNRFVEEIAKMEKQFSMKFPKGCSEDTKKAVAHFVSMYGKESLNGVAKLHFKLSLETQN